MAVGAGAARVVGASATYNHGGANSVQSLAGNGFAYPCGVPLASAGREQKIIAGRARSYMVIKEP